MECSEGAEHISPAHARHVLRYVQALAWLGDKRKTVIDAGCGTGYGTAILATKHDVCGVDLDNDALLAAQLNYPGLKFQRASVLAGMGAEAVVLIEVIEHLSKDDGLTLIKTLDTTELILSTPYCLVSGPGAVTKQHLHEYSLTDLEETLYQGRFSIDQIKLQRTPGMIGGRLGYCMVRAVRHGAQ